MHDPVWTRLAWDQLWQVSLTIAAIWLIVRRYARTKPQLAYLLWMIVILKCVTPPIWDSPTGLFSWLQHVSNPVVSLTVLSNERNGTITSVPENTNRVDAPNLESNAEPATQNPVSVTTEHRTVVVARNLRLPLRIAAAVWIFGVLAVASRIGWKWKRFRDALRTGPETARIEEQVQKLAAKLSLRHVPRVAWTALPTVPAVFGFLRPMIVLPESLLKSETNLDLEPILAHELVHLYRADTLVGRLQLLVQTLWWFHPLVWWANFETRRERERACDEMVISLMDYEPLRCANCLVSIAELSKPSRECGLCLHPDSVAAINSFRLLANRLEHITSPATEFRVHVSWLYPLTFLLVAALLLPGAATSVFNRFARSSNSTENSETVVKNTAAASFGGNNPFGSEDVDSHWSVANAPVLDGISIDGKLNDWPLAIARHAFFKILADGSQSWSGNDFSTSPDLSCVFMVGYSPAKQELYVAVVVRDDTLIVGNGSDRDTDAIELYVDGLRNRRVYPREGVIDRHWFENAELQALPVQQYCAIPGEGRVYGASKLTNPLLIAGDLEKTKTRMAFTRAGDIITYEWAIQVFDRYPDQPTKLERGKRIGFDLAVVDKDVPLTGSIEDEPATDRRAWIYWGPVWRGKKVFDSGSLGEIVLGE